MHSLKQHGEHLLRVMLSKALELDRLARHPVLDIPRCHVPRPAQPEVVQKLGKGHGQTASCAQRILLIHMVQVDLK